jgi:hypothetical protein
LRTSATAPAAAAATAPAAAASTAVSSCCPVLLLPGLHYSLVGSSPS